MRILFGLVIGAVTRAVCSIRVQGLHLPRMTVCTRFFWQRPVMIPRLPVVDVCGIPDIRGYVSIGPE